MRNAQLSTKPIAKVAIYARYSSKNQSSASAKDQIDRALYKVEKGQISLTKFPLSTYELKVAADWIVKDEAKSGKTPGRKGYEKILNGIREQQFDVLLVDDLSRLTRDLGDQLALYDLIEFRDIELYSICESISSKSPNAKTFFSIKGVINDLGNQTHAARTKRGQEARVLKGFSTGDTCFGYTSEPTATRSRGGHELPCDFKIAINPVEAKVVVEIFDLFIKGFGKSKIAKHLNEKGIPSTTRGFKITGKRVNWNQSLVGKILTREKYIGRWQWNKAHRVRNPETGKIVRKETDSTQWVSHLGEDNIREELSIIPIEKWDAAQKKIQATTKKYHQRKSKTESMASAKVPGLSSNALLAGVLKCHDCESQFLQISGKSGGYMGCYLHHRKDRKACVNKRLINRSKVEKAVVKKIIEVLTDDSHLKMATEALNKRIKARMNYIPQEIKLLEEQEKGVDREIQNLLRFVMENGSVSPAVTERLRENESRKQSLSVRLRSLKSAEKDRLLITPFALKERYQRLEATFEKNPALANAALRQLIPEGLVCIPNQGTLKKNHNQNNSKWAITGRIAVGADGFSDLGIGGGGGN